MIPASVILAYISLLAFGLADNIRGPVFSEILKEFSLSDTAGSLIFALSSTFGFVSSYCVKWVLRKISYEKIVQGSLVLLSLALILFASAQVWLQMLFGAVIFGLSIGFLGVSQNALVALGSQGVNRPRWLSGLHAMYALSSCLAPLIVAALTTWRMACWVAAVIPLLILVISFWIPSHLQRRVESSTEKLKSNRGLRWKAALFFSLYVLAELVISTRLGLFFRREMGESLAHSSLMVSAFFVSMLAGRTLMFFIHPPVPLFVQLALSLSISTLCLILGLTVQPLCLVISGFTMAPFYAHAVTYLSEVFHESVQEAITTAMILQSVFVVIMHLTVGLLSDALSLTRALWIGPCALLLSLVFLLWTQRSSRANA